MTLSIIGCVVNGPGEALMTDIGVTGGGNGRHMVYAAGKTDHTIDGGDMVDHIVELVEKPRQRRCRRGEGGGEGRRGVGFRMDVVALDISPLVSPMIVWQRG